MRAQSDQPLGLDALVAAQNLPHRALQVVIPQAAEYSAE
jgi:hypothetical protein